MSAGSARGLFRATGNKSKPVVVELLDGTLGKSDGGLVREKDDFLRMLDRKDARQAEMFEGAA